MSRNAAGVEPHLKVVARPSLYTTDPAKEAAEKHVSILASLEPDSPARKISRAWSLSILIALVVIGLAYWAYVNALFRQPLVIPAWVETALNISKAPIPVVQPGPMPIIAKLDKPADVPVEESHAATIVTEPALPAATVPAESKSEPSDKLAKLDPELTQKKITVQAPAASAAPAVTEKTAKTEKPGTNEIAGHKNAIAPKADAKVVEKAHADTHAKTEASKKTKDEDVDLIAALLSRVSHQDASAKEAKNKKNSTATNSSATTGSAKRQGKADPNRDIVTRADGDTTEGLIKRCKSLGFFEGELCRIRICSSLWGKDPACPAPDQVALPNQN